MTENGKPLRPFVIEGWFDARDIDAELPVEVVSCGVPFLFVPVRSLDAARRARPRAELIERVAGDRLPPEVFVFAREVEHEGSTVHSRMFAPTLGITEDPATGGASGPLGCYLVRYGLVACDPTAEIVVHCASSIGAGTSLPGCGATRTAGASLLPQRGPSSQ